MERRRSGLLRPLATVALVTPMFWAAQRFDWTLGLRDWFVIPMATLLFLFCMTAVLSIVATLVFALWATGRWLGDLRRRRPLRPTLGLPAR